MMPIFVGCAGWSIRKELADSFPAGGSHLQRYAGRFHAVEINSSFYRPHRRSTYQRWAETTPEGFRFSVKCPKQITHVQRLVDAQPQIDQFVLETSGLGEKLGAVLVQLPPSLAFKQPIAEQFFAALRTSIATPLVCEPRHRSWFAPAAETLLLKHDIGRVAADPAVVPAAGQPAGSLRVRYFRWHGWPKMYYSSYDDDALRRLAAEVLGVAGQGDEVWCIFDNTAEGAAIVNALQLGELVG